MGRSIFSQTIVAASVALAVTAQLVWAETYRLFNPDGSYSKDFSAIVKSLKSGDVLEFGEPPEEITRFVFEEKLSQGTRNSILKVTPQQGPGAGKIAALRIALVPKRGTGLYINDTIDAVPLLRQYGVPAVEVKSHRMDQYVLVEALDIQFSFEELMVSSTIDLSADDQVTRDLVEFIKKTSHLKIIDDFHAGQVVYAKGRGWLLIDWGRNIDAHSGVGHAGIDDTVFGDFSAHFYSSRTPPAVKEAWSELEPQIDALIEQERKNGNAKRLAEEAKRRTVYAPTAAYGPSGGPGCVKTNLPKQP